MIDANVHRALHLLALSYIFDVNGVDHLLRQCVQMLFVRLQCDERLARNLSLRTQQITVCIVRVRIIEMHASRCDTVTLNSGKHANVFAGPAQQQIDKCALQRTTEAVKEEKIINSHNATEREREREREEKK